MGGHDRESNAVTPREEDRRDDGARDRKRETKRKRVKEKEGGSEGRKEGRNSQFISRHRGDKREEMNEGTCQLTSALRHPSPVWTPSQLEASPSASPTPFASSSHQGVDVKESGTKQNVLHLMLHTPRLTAPAVLLNQTSDITSRCT